MNICCHLVPIELNFYAFNLVVIHCGICAGWGKEFIIRYFYHSFSIRSLQISFIILFLFFVVSLAQYIALFFTPFSPYLCLFQKLKLKKEWMNNESNRNKIDKFVLDVFHLELCVKNKSICTISNNINQFNHFISIYRKLCQSI